LQLEFFHNLSSDNEFRFVVRSIPAMKEMSGADSSFLLGTFNKISVINKGWSPAEVSISNRRLIDGAAIRGPVQRLRLVRFPRQVRELASETVYYSPLVASC
jgi:hypothetical protein